MSLCCPSGNELKIRSRSASAIAGKLKRLQLSDGKSIHWSSEEKEVLKIGILEGKLLSEIDLPGRSLSSRFSCAKKLGLAKKVRKNRRSWSDEEIKLLRQEAKEKSKPSDIVIPGKTAAQIMYKLSELKIRMTHYKRGRLSKDEAESIRQQISSGTTPRQCKLRRRSKEQILAYLEKEGLTDRSNRHWTSREKAELRRQCAAGKMVKDMEIPGRSVASIRAQIKELGIVLRRRPWSSEEITSLRKQLDAGTPWKEIQLPLRKGEQPRGLSTIKRFAFDNGLAERNPARKAWSKVELVILRLLRRKGYSALQMKEEGEFFNERTLRNGTIMPERSLDAISQQIRRLKLGDPERSERARKGRRNIAIIGSELDEFIKRHGKEIPAWMIASMFGVSRSTVKTRGQKLGVSLTWEEAVALPDSKYRSANFKEERSARSAKGAETKRRKAN